jgi:BioD-like phosphotransacetylase family protein
VTLVGVVEEEAETQIAMFGNPTPYRMYGVGRMSSLFVARSLGLSEAQTQPPVLMLTPDRVHQRVRGQDQTNYIQTVQQNLQRFDTELVLLEGPGTLQEGCLFHLSLPEIAEALTASVILVERLQPQSTVDHLIFARQQLGDRLMGVVINDFTLEQKPVLTDITDFLEQQGIPIFRGDPSKCTVTQRQCRTTGAAVTSGSDVL